MDEGVVADMKELGITESLRVKEQGEGGQAL